MERADPAVPARAGAAQLLLMFRPHVLRRLEMQPLRWRDAVRDEGEEIPHPALVLSAALRFRRYVRRERLT